MSLERFDSLSRYQSNDLFHVGTSQGFKQGLVAAEQLDSSQFPKDTIEINKEKIKRSPSATELANKISHFTARFSSNWQVSLYDNHLPSLFSSLWLA